MGLRIINEDGKFFETSSHKLVGVKRPEHTISDEENDFLWQQDHGNSKKKILLA
jgi:hypothetical protein